MVPVLWVTSTGSEDSWSCSVYSLFYTACRQPVMLSLCSVTACSVQPCVATTVSYTTQRRKCCLPPVPPMSPATLDMSICLWKLLLHLPPSSPPSWSHVCHISALRETCPESPTDQEEEGRMNGRRLKWLLVFVIDFHPILPALQPPVNTPLPYHLPLHPVTVTISQPPRSALCCVPLTDRCFTLPLVLPQPKTHSLSASSMQDLSALPGEGPTYPPSFRTTTSTLCCWRSWWRGQDRRPGFTWVLGPLLLPLCRGVWCKRREHHFHHKGLSLAACHYHFVLSRSAPLLWNRSVDSNIQQATNQLVLYLPPSTQQKEQILWLHVFQSVFQLPWTLWQFAWQNTPYGWL